MVRCRTSPLTLSPNPFLSRIPASSSFSAGGDRGHGSHAGPRLRPSPPPGCRANRVAARGFARVCRPRLPRLLLSLRPATVDPCVHRRLSMQPFDVTGPRRVPTMGQSAQATQLLLGCHLRTRSKHARATRGVKCSHWGGKPQVATSCPRETRLGEPGRDGRLAPTRQPTVEAGGTFAWPSPRARHPSVHVHVVRVC